MPSIARSSRPRDHRGLRRRGATLVVLLAVPTTALLAVRFADGSPAGRSALTSTGTTAPLDPPAASRPTGLHSGLVDAFERAQASAEDAGHDLSVTSGFRSAEEQSELLEAEIAERGSQEEALWWVFPPDRSMHVQGLAVDVGDGPAADWLAEEGDRFGLCRTLAWEWWHFEWRQRWEEAGACPSPAEVPSDAPSA